MGCTVPVAETNTGGFISRKFPDMSELNELDEGVTTEDSTRAGLEHTEIASGEDESTMDDVVGLLNVVVGALFCV